MVKKYALLFFAILGFAELRAQDSMMQEVSYVFLEKLIATAKENLPTMDSYETRVNVARAGLNRESVSWFDAFSVSYIYNPENILNTAEPMIFKGYQVAFNLNLGTLLQKPSNVRQAKENLKLAEHDLAQYHITLEAEVKRRYFSYLQALNLLKLQTNMTNEALNLSRDNRLKFEKSEITFEQYTASQISYNAAIQSKIGAEANFLTAKASLEELLNKRVEEVQ